MLFEKTRIATWGLVWTWHVFFSVLRHTFTTACTSVCQFWVSASCCCGMSLFQQLIQALAVEIAGHRHVFFAGLVAPLLLVALGFCRGCVVRRGCTSKVYLLCGTCGVEGPCLATGCQHCRQALACGFATACFLPTPTRLGQHLECAGMLWRVAADAWCIYSRTCPGATPGPVRSLLVYVAACVLTFCRSDALVAPPAGVSVLLFWMCA